MFASLRHWIQAARPLAAVNIVLPLLLGHAAAYNASRAFDVAWLALSLLWGIALQLHIVFSNDVADADYDSSVRTAISGGSGVVVDGKISRVRLAGAARAAALLTFVIAIGIVLLGRPWALAFTLVSFGLLWAYHGAPRRSYRGGGEWLQGLGTGGVLPALAFYLQTGSVAPWWLIVPAVIAGTAGNVSTAIPDLDTDQAAGKRTMPVRLGIRGAGIFVTVALAAAGVLSAVASPSLSQTARLIVAGATLAAPLCLAAMRRPFVLALAQSGVHVAWLVIWSAALVGRF